MYILYMGKRFAWLLLDAVTKLTKEVTGIGAKNPCGLNGDWC